VVRSVRRISRLIDVLLEEEEEVQGVYCKADILSECVQMRFSLPIYYISS
jgi:hypothetical protein